jgi:hypothetical protein
MTIQSEEKIIINDKQYVLLSQPLEPFLKLLDKNLKLIPFGSHCWRGYMGTWTIINNVLYLTHLKIQYDKKDEEKLTPLLLDEVFYQATWYSGVLRVPFGKPYERTGYEYPLHEKEMIFTVENGLITNHEIIENDEPVYDEDDELPF